MYVCMNVCIDLCGTVCFDFGPSPCFHLPPGHLHWHFATQILLHRRAAVDGLAIAGPAIQRHNVEVLLASLEIRFGIMMHNVGNPMPQTTTI